MQTSLSKLKKMWKSPNGTIRVELYSERPLFVRTFPWLDKADCHRASRPCRPGDLSYDSLELETTYYFNGCMSNYDCEFWNNVRNHFYGFQLIPTLQFNIVTKCLQGELSSNDNLIGTYLAIKFIMHKQPVTNFKN